MYPWRACILGIEVNLESRGGMQQIVEGRGWVGSSQGYIVPGKTGHTISLQVKTGNI